MRPEEKVQGRRRRHRRVRKVVFGTGERPRLNVFRSLRHIHAQIINDEKGHTLVAASTLSPEFKARGAAGKKVERARAVGEILAEKARAAGIARVVFDRGGYQYHGRVKALADGARSKGLQF